MASRLIPLLIGTCAAAAIGCGGSSVTAPRTDSLPADVPAGRARLWAVGDSAGGANAPAVARLIRRGHPGKVLYLGDIYNGDSGFRAYRRLYGRLPVARTPGNHDWPRFWTYRREWYSFTAGGWRIIELNSETSRDGAQLAYLRTLLRARGTCRLAFWHRPRFSAGPHGDNGDMDPYWRALQDHASLVVSGHDHDMQRFTPRGGLTQLVAGSGGNSHYPVDRSKPGLAFADDRHFGALRIDLSRGKADLAFVAADGRVLDAHSVVCRP